MGRIYKDIHIDGKQHHALFDSGSLITYIVAEAVPLDCDCKRLPTPIPANLAGKKHILKTRCLIPIEIDNTKLLMDAFIATGDIGKPPDSENEIDVLFGATMMETWGIKLNPEKCDIDLTETKKREFLSF